MTVLCENLKRLRLAKSMTQERAAEVLGVSAQTISRWECGTTLPDATMLPGIARLYGVTIDDLYRETSVAYDNYAQRLASVFEASLQPEDFILADREFKKLIKGGEHTAEDLRLYGILYQHMMYVCINKATELFDRVLKAGPGENPKTYWSVKHQKGYFLWEIGRNRENIDEFLPLVEAGSDELQEWICLIQAYSFAGELETAWNWTQKAEAKFPESATLHIYAGDLLRSMKRYDEAFLRWRRARELEPEWCDAAWSMGSCYEELEQWDKAYETWCGIADHLAERGYEAEVAYPRELARRCREKMKG